MRLSLYRRLPEPLRRSARRVAAWLPPSWRLGKTYRTTRRFLEAADRWPEERIRQWQSDRLIRIVDHAIAYVPGYQLLYREAGITRGDIRTPEDLRNVPFTTKELIWDNLADFTARDIPSGDRVYRTTGGSTGIPFGFHLAEADIPRETAFIHQAWNRVGWRFGERSAVLRGRFIGSGQRLSEFDPLMNELHLSTYQLTDATYPAYRELLRTSGLSVLQAYPSAAFLLARLVLQHGDAGAIPVTTLFLGSENLYDWQRDLIRTAFPGARILAWYGHAEQVLFAPSCEGSEAYHLHPLYGLGEILDSADAPVGEGDSGELVGTSLWATATPFIRYRIRDFATRGADVCPRCQRPYPLLSRIDGRLQEFIVTQTGRTLSMTQINMHNSVFDNVKQFQFHQAVSGRITLNLVRKPDYSEEDSRRIRREIGEKLGTDVDWEIAFVETIPRSPSGKVSFLRQEMDLGFGDRPDV